MDKYIKISDLKSKLNYIFRSYGVGKATREAINNVISKIPYVVKGELETTIESDGTLNVEQTRNISKYAPCDDFICEKCGVRLGDWVKSVYDEDAEDTYHYEYEFKFCPECSRRVVEE